MLKQFAVVIRVVSIISTIFFCNAFAKAPKTMVKVMGGNYAPAFAEALEGTKKNNSLKVQSFYLDARPVTNIEFLSFLKENQKWKKSKITALYADKTYLNYWFDDDTYGPNDKRPVVNVSWFVARAYCQWKGKRLPKVIEWEYAASADEKSFFALDDDKFKARIRDWYAKPMKGLPGEVGSTFKNVWGVWDMHGLVWEWTEDFNTALVSGESRADATLDKKLYCAGGSVGAQDFKDYAAFMRFGFRSSLKASYTLNSLGFRCAKDIEESTDEK